MYKEGDKVYFQLGKIWNDKTWYKGIVHQPYKNLPVFQNGCYSIIGVNKTIHCFANETQLKYREEKDYD